MRYESGGRVLDQFRASNAFVRGIRGPFGSGKSTACVAEIVRRAKLQHAGPDGIRRSRWAAIRNTYPELKTTTIKTWHDWMPREAGKWQDQGPPTHFIKAEDLDLEVMFLALDRPEDVGKMLSLELTGAWLNEAREIDKAILDHLTGRVGRYPSAEHGGVSWRGIIMDTNSPDTTHWWYDLAEESHPTGYEFFSQPSGLSTEAENLNFLNQNSKTLALPKDHPERLAQGRRYYEQQIAGKDEAWLKVYIRGEYGFIQDGKPIYPEYRDAVHCRDVAVYPKLPIYVGLDFGLTPAAVFAQRGPMGRWAWLSEIVSTDMGAKRFAELLGAEMRSRYAGHEFEIYGDPSGDSRAQTDETTAFEVLRAAGIPARPAPSNDPMLRREAVVSALTRIIDGEPGLIVSPQCVVLRKGMMGGYRYKRLEVKGERYHDKPDKNQYSHVCEAAQYLMLGAGEGRALIRSADYGRPRQDFAEQEYDPFASLRSGGLARGRPTQAEDRYDPLA